MSKNKLSSLNNNRYYAVLMSVIENMPGHFYWKDPEGVYMGCNDKQAKSLGLKSGDDVIGKTDFDLPWPAESARQFRENDLWIMSSGQAEIFEETANIDGHVATVLSIKAPIKDGDSTFNGVLGISIDITAQKEAEKREKEALVRIVAEQKESENLREKVQTMKMLGGTIAHEIRNPLLAINSAREALEKFLPILLKAYHQTIEKDDSFEFIPPILLNEIPNMLNVIKSETDASHLFIDTLLSKIKEKPDTKDLEKCSMSDCINIALDRYPFGTNERDKVHWLKNDDFVFYGNKTMMVHVLFNLLKNALHYLGVANKGEITLWVEKDANAHYLHFKDTGTGVAPDVLPQLFTRFFSQTRYGTGLGLAFCKNVMESLHGDICCQSVEGEYTEFILSFPLS